MSRPQSTWEEAIRQWHWRKYHDDDFTEGDSRREFSKDYDRVLYSTAFRRLGGVTQVAASSEIALFHNRLTHALKTAQVGARIANQLCANYEAASYAECATIDMYGGIEPRVVRAACLAYSLGRPPFGLTGVAELQRITSEPDKIISRRMPERDGPKRSPQIVADYLLTESFNESAQSFRIVTKLAFRERPHQKDDCPALNLTRGTLAAMLKYPWGYGNDPSCVGTSRHHGYYQSEAEIATWIFGSKPPLPSRQAHLPGRDIEYRTIEAQVLDLSYDISYAIHDVEDFFRVGLIPLNYLAQSRDEWDRFFNYAYERKLKYIFGENEYAFVYGQGEHIRDDLLPKTPYVGSQADRIALHKFASTLIKDATDNTSITGEGIVKVETAQLARIELLKQLTWYYVIDRPSLESLQRGQRVLIRSLYNHLIEWVEELWDGQPLVDPKQHRINNQLPARLLEYLDIVSFYDPLPRAIPGHNNSDRQIVSRAVIDYIASLTELQAVELHARLTGHSTHATLQSWFLP